MECGSRNVPASIISLHATSSIISPCYCFSDHPAWYRAGSPIFDWTIPFVLAMNGTKCSHNSDSTHFNCKRAHTFRRFRLRRKRGLLVSSSGNLRPTWTHLSVNFEYRAFRKRPIDINISMEDRAGREPNDVVNLGRSVCEKRRTRSGRRKRDGQ